MKPRPLFPLPRRIVCRGCGEIVARCTYVEDECEECHGDAERRRRGALVTDFDRRQRGSPVAGDRRYDGARTSAGDA